MLTRLKLPLLLLMLFVLAIVFVQQPATATEPLAPDTAAPTTVPLPIGQQAFKIEVAADGIYEINYADLVAAGLSDDSDPAALELLYRGETVAYQFVGDDDAQFEDGEAIRFYGWAFEGPRHEERYIINNVFWLINGTAATISTADNPYGYAPVTTAPATVTYEQDRVFSYTFIDDWHNFPNDADEWYTDRYPYYFGGETIQFDDNNDGVIDREVYFPDYTYDIPLVHPAATSKPATFEVEYTNSSDGVIDVTATLGDGQAHRRWVNARNINVIGTVANDQLVDGDNPFTIAGNAYEPSGAQYERSNNGKLWFNRVTVNYWRDLLVDDDQIIFDVANEGAHEFWLSGYGEGDADNLLVWNVGDRHAPVRIAVGQNDAFSSDGATHTWRVAAEHTADAQFIATTAANVKRPLTISSYTPPSLEPSGNGADWIVISHADFIDAIEPLAEFRRTVSHHQTHVVDVQDVFNQYSDGFPIPAGIQNYLRHTLVDWDRAPRYVILGGDADWNPKRLDCSLCVSWDISRDQNFIPVDLQFTNPETGLIVTDHTYTTLLGDDLVGDIALGRLPAQTAQDMQNMVEKIILYENRMINGTNANRFILPSDDADLAGNFCNGNKELLNSYIPSSYETTEICLDAFLDANAGAPNSTSVANEQWRNAIFKEVNSAQGIDLLNYRGHGSIQYWASRAVSSAEHLDMFDNAGRPSFFISHDCLDSDFSRNKEASLGETFLKLEDKGTAGHLGATGLGYDWQHMRLQRAFYHGLYNEGKIRVGDANRYGHDEYLRRLPNDHFIYEIQLLGDPAMLIAPPPPLTPRIMLPILSR